MKSINIGLIGFGNVGRGVVKLLGDKKSLIRKRTGSEFLIKRICEKKINLKHSVKVSKSIFTRDAKDILNDPKIDIVIELIGGIHPAKEFILEALRRGKHVVTANKALLAEEGKEIFRLAAKKKRELYFEASVGAGLPVIKTLREGLVANRFSAVFGIINGTSNFVLSKMAGENCSFKTALQEVKKRGFAERNPFLDIEGIDSAHKLAILVYLAFGKMVRFKDIFVEGISRISLADVKYANELNLVIKLLAIAKKVNNNLEVRVHPTLIPKTNLLASVEGVFNAIYLHSDLAGNILLYGEGAGQSSAASAIISDLVDLAKIITGKSENKRSIFPDTSVVRKLRKIDEILTRYYVRFMAIDKPGVLAKISGIFGRYGISIASVTQKERKKALAVPIVMVTHEAKEKHMHVALEKITRLQIIKGEPVAIRMEQI
ncbi:MAG: homoserine dehydrogenase [Candidatus Omnitrophica bacterium]|nr:homoserine dehydrogenase [Candidatus Omnitrophota bacterium]